MQTGFYMCWYFKVGFREISYSVMEIIDSDWLVWKYTITTPPKSFWKDSKQNIVVN